MPKILDDYYQKNKPEFKVTKEQKNLFLKELLEYGDFDSFCYAKKALSKMGEYTSVLHMPIARYLMIHASAYQFDYDSKIEIPYIFWRNVYEQIIEDSML